MGISSLDGWVGIHVAESYAPPTELLTPRHASSKKTGHKISPSSGLLCLSWITHTVVVVALRVIAEPGREVDRGAASARDGEGQDEDDDLSTAVKSSCKDVVLDTND